MITIGQIVLKIIRLIQIDDSQKTEAGNLFFGILGHETSRKHESLAYAQELKTSAFSEKWKLSHIVSVREKDGIGNNYNELSSKYYCQ